MDGLLRFARNDGLMHLGGRKHIIVLDHAAIHITQTQMPGTSPGMMLCSLMVGAK